MRSVTCLRSLARLTTPVIAGLLIACSEAAAPDARLPERDGASTSARSLLGNLGLPLPGTGPTVLEFRHGAPPLEQQFVSFYARKGQTRSASLYFRLPNGRRGAEYARLVVPANALAKHANGRSIAFGDSVLITIAAPDQQHLLLRMEPEGLTFDRRSPANLTMRYTEANPDYNGDGRVNAVDALLELRFALWRQPTLLDLFSQLASLLDRSSKSVSADLPGFSQYIIAY